MDRKEFAGIVSALRTFYPREQLLPNDQAVMLWYNHLQDLSFDTAWAALNKWVATNKWSPSIAELREYAGDITYGKEDDWSEAWQKAREAVWRYGSYNPIEALESLDELTRETVKRIGYHDLCKSENHDADRANFRDIYKNLAKRRREETFLPEHVKALIEKAAPGIEDKRRV